MKIDKTVKNWWTIIHPCFENGKIFWKDKNGIIKQTGYWTNYNKIVWLKS